MANKKGNVREVELDADIIFRVTDMHNSSPLLLATEIILPNYFVELVLAALLSN
jgi:hypothetical protein